MGFFSKISSGISNLFSNPLDWLSNVGEDVYNVTQLPGDLAKSITGSDKLKNFINPPSWDQWGKPGEAFYNKVNAVNAYVPTKELRQYAPQIEGAVLSAFNPFAGAAFNTAYNAGQMQATQKGMDWGAVGKNALVNFGTAAAQQLANTAAQNAQKAQAGKALEAKTASAYQPGGPGAGGTTSIPTPSNYSGSITVPGVQGSPGLEATGALANFKNAAPSAVSASASAGTSIGDAAYNSAIKNSPQLANQALTQTLTPEASQPISGVTDSGMGVNTGATYQPTGEDIFKAFGGSALGNNDFITEDQLNQMYKDFGLNTGMQLNATRDLMLPAGQTLPEPNTPYSSQVANIGKSYAKGGEDLTNQVNTENYNRYNTNLFGAIQQANPNVTQDVFQGWLNNPDTRPVELMNFFQPAPQPVSLMM